MANTNLKDTTANTRTAGVRLRDLFAEFRRSSWATLLLTIGSDGGDLLFGYLAYVSTTVHESISSWTSN